VKLFMKEDQTPAGVDRVVYNLAPMLAVIPAIMILAVIPWAGEITMVGSLFTPYFAIAPGLDVAILFMLAITSIGVYGVVLAGWASNSKYAVLGGIRASAQMISYELALGLSVLIPVMLADSMDMGAIVAAQRSGWYLLIQPVAAGVFFIGVLAELQRSPFDLLEAEQELSAGFNVEYAGMRFGMFMMAEYMKMILLSAIFVTFFMGGFNGPFIDELPGLGFLYIILKIAFCLFLMIWIRASTPRLRYDQLMNFGWKTLLPITVLNFIVTAVFIVMAEEGAFEPLLIMIRGIFGG
ncbi:MAG: NADH-quinone oxidoreductase subunit H, partial [Methylococcales bacterium]|nr:NADH-quinone oxidoreductase subunit H [Methylococcales bacterium]